MGAPGDASASFVGQWQAVGTPMQDAIDESGKPIVVPGGCASGVTVAVEFQSTAADVCFVCLYGATAKGQQVPLAAVVANNQSFEQISDSLQPLIVASGLAFASYVIKVGGLGAVVRVHATINEAVTEPSIVLRRNCSIDVPDRPIGMPIATPAFDGVIATQFGDSPATARQYVSAQGGESIAEIKVEPAPGIFGTLFSLLVRIFADAASGSYFVQLHDACTALSTATLVQTLDQMAAGESETFTIDGWRFQNGIKVALSSTDRTYTAVDPVTHKDMSVMAKYS